MFEILTADSAVTVAIDIELTGNCLGSGNMIARNHDRPDPCLPAKCNGFLRFRARRINHTNQSEKNQIAFQIIEVRLFRQIIHPFIGNRQNAQSLFAHVLHYRFTPGGVLVLASFDNAVKRTFNDHRQLTIQFMNSRH